MGNAALKAILQDQNVKTAEIPGTEGGSILVIDAGARVLRLVGKSGRDFLWLNRSLFDDSARFLNANWLNFGGDRTWIAPERSIHISDLRDPWGTYAVPKAFDPGSYNLQQYGNAVMLASRFRLTNHVLQVLSELSIEKTVTPVANPFRHSSDAELSSAEYIGYEQATTIKLHSESVPGLQFGLWHLAQVEAPGEILVPITNSEPPHVYFGSADADNTKIEPGLIRFGVNGTQQKVGIKTDATFGRVGFIREDGEGLWSLLVRNFFVNPSGEYVDVPWDDPNNRGYAVQCYCDDGNLGNFGELEYHTTGIGDGTGTNTCTDISQLWAFRAERPIIERIANRLLAVSI